MIDHYGPFRVKGKGEKEAVVGLDDSTLERINRNRMLGMYVDDKVLFEEHVGPIISKAIMKFDLISKAKQTGVNKADLLYRISIS